MYTVNQPILICIYRSNLVIIIYLLPCVDEEYEDYLVAGGHNLKKVTKSSAEIK